MLCSIEFKAENLYKIVLLGKKLSEADRGFKFLQDFCKLGKESWILTENYKEAIAFFRNSKKETIAEAESAEE